MSKIKYYLPLFIGIILVLLTVFLFYNIIIYDSSVDRRARIALKTMNPSLAYRLTKPYVDKGSIFSEMTFSLAKTELANASKHPFRYQRKKDKSELPIKNIKENLAEYHRISNYTSTGHRFSKFLLSNTPIVIFIILLRELGVV